MQSVPKTTVTGDIMAKSLQKNNCLAAGLIEKNKAKNRQRHEAPRPLAQRTGQDNDLDAAKTKPLLLKEKADRDRELNQKRARCAKPKP